MRPTAAVLLLFFATILAPGAERARCVQSLDADWLFAVGDTPAAEQPMLDVVGQNYRENELIAAVSFALNGPGVIAAVDNGDRASHEPFQASGHRVFHGSCVAFIKASDSSGAITVSASDSGLASATVSITAVPASLSHP